MRYIQDTSLSAATEEAATRECHADEPQQHYSMLRYIAAILHAAIAIACRRPRRRFRLFSEIADAEMVMLIFAAPAVFKDIAQDIYASIYLYFGPDTSYR
jgi:hypothetical protein